MREYREVLLRPAIRRHHGLAERDVDAVLRALALNASVRDPPPAPDSPPDAGDRHVWALLADDPTAVLVTGDEVLIRGAPEPGRVLSPRRFLTRIR